MPHMDSDVYKRCHCDFEAQPVTASTPAAEYKVPFQPSYSSKPSWAREALPTWRQLVLLSLLAMLLSLVWGISVGSSSYGSGSEDSGGDSLHINSSMSSSSLTDSSSSSIGISSGWRRRLGLRRIVPGFGPLTPQLHKLLAAIDVDFAPWEEDGIHIQQVGCCQST